MRHREAHLFSFSILSNETRALVLPLRNWRHQAQSETGRMWKRDSFSASIFTPLLRGASFEDFLPPPLALPSAAVALKMRSRPSWDFDVFVSKHRVLFKRKLLIHLFPPVRLDKDVAWSLTWAVIQECLHQLADIALRLPTFHLFFSSSAQRRVLPSALVSVISPWPGCFAVPNVLIKASVVQMQGKKMQIIELCRQTIFFTLYEAHTLLNVAMETGTFKDTGTCTTAHDNAIMRSWRGWNEQSTKGLENKPQEGRVSLYLVFQLVNSF